MSRRELLIAGLGGLTPAAPTSPDGLETPGTEVVELWPGPPPGAPDELRRERVVSRDSGVRPDRAISGVGRPRLTVFRPAAAPSGVALLLMPGGGYVRESFDLEGAEVARRFGAAGATAFVLTYRLPGEGWAAGPDAPLQDARRAMRLIRTDARRWGVDPRRVGAIGFSAGGHLCARLATGDDPPSGEPVAPDAPSTRPDFAALMYPVISMRPGVAHAGSRTALLGPDPDEARIDRYSAELHVAHDAAPTFIAQAADDPSVSPANSLLMFSALRAAGVRAELHLFQAGGHGFGLRRPASETASLWPELLARWAAQNGFAL